MPHLKTAKFITYLIVGVTMLALMVPLGTAMLTSGEAVAAARTYKSKGSQENVRNLYETCRLKKVERVDGTVMCIYRRQTGKKDVTLSNEDPSSACQRQFQCKRTD